MSGASDSSSLPAIAIVGRPNVGKSSLFNAVVGRRLAIVHELPGVTRDRVMATVVRDGRKFRLIDTGGLGLLAWEKKGGEVWDPAIADQVAAAVDSAEILISRMSSVMMRGGSRSVKRLFSTIIRQEYSVNFLPRNRNPIYTGTAFSSRLITLNGTFRCSVSASRR